MLNRTSKGFRKNRLQECSQQDQIYQIRSDQIRSDQIRSLTGCSKGKHANHTCEVIDYFRWQHPVQGIACRPAFSCCQQQCKPEGIAERAVVGLLWTLSQSGCCAVYDNACRSTFSCCNLGVLVETLPRRTTRVNHIRRDPPFCRWPVAVVKNHQLHGTVVFCLVACSLTHSLTHYVLAMHAGLFSAAATWAAAVETPQEGLRWTPAGGHGTLHLPGLPAGVGHSTQSGQLGF